MSRNQSSLSRKLSQPKTIKRIDGEDSPYKRKRFHPGKGDDSPFKRTIQRGGDESPFKIRGQMSIDYSPERIKSDVSLPTIGEVKHPVQSHYDSFSKSMPKSKLRFKGPYQFSLIKDPVKIESDGIKAI